eukprot:TRINITY_DN4999_c0_g1_i13.p1 TRINITY_DN4999_c0_g1~~TRINITY_DN4999_c0_g1_i13.p1  ORF type:complete len:356 (-),score=103.42 TRINITY_DN4999_c0_g1_i13:205-1272(-)
MLRSLVGSEMCIRDRCMHQQLVCMHQQLRCMQIMKDYQMVDVPTIKHLFLQSYQTAHGQPAELVRSGSRSVTQHELSASQLCTVLAPEGKGLVSIWQLRWHFELHPEMQDALDKAPVMLEPRSVEALVPSWMTTLEWFQRCGLASHVEQEYVWNLEQAGFERAFQFQSLTPEELATACKMDDDEHKRIAEAVLSLENKRADIVFGFHSPSQPRVLREFRIAYPECTAGEADAFSWGCCNQLGRGLVSLTQILAHFKRHDSAAEAVDAMGPELMAPPRVAPVVPPAPEKPTDWVAGWLEENQLAEYVPLFLDHKICTKADLLLKEFADQDLKNELGVNKLGHRRQLLALLAELHAD